MAVVLLAVVITSWTHRIAVHQGPQQGPDPKPQTSTDDRIKKTATQETLPSSTSSSAMERQQPSSLVSNNATLSALESPPTATSVTTLVTSSLSTASGGKDDIGVVSGSHSAPEDLSNTIAYAISLIKCGDHQSTPAGLIDAALVLRHSVHMTSSRNPESGSKYDYRMIAIVHKKAETCSTKLRTVGFEIMVVDTPIQPKNIRGRFLRKMIDREWCCGHGESKLGSQKQVVDTNQHPSNVHRLHNSPHVSHALSVR